MAEADIVASSTSSPHSIVEREALAEVMSQRADRPLLLIDLAVPRDIHPACRELAGVTLYDMDDLQALVERNASGREAEARRADGVLRSELARFERWLATQDVAPTIAALRSRGSEVVERVLAENESRWEGLTKADRERVETMAKAIASRILTSRRCGCVAPRTRMTPTPRSPRCATCSASTPRASRSRPRARCGSCGGETGIRVRGLKPRKQHVRPPKAAARDS
jgi:hypothetical protein